MATSVFRVAFFLSATGALGAYALAGCVSNDEPLAPPNDAGLDAPAFDATPYDAHALEASADSAADAPLDVAVDAAIDAPSDAGIDASDAAADAPPEVGMDALIDAPADASADSVADALPDVVDAGGGGTFAYLVGSGAIAGYAISPSGAATPIDMDPNTQGFQNAATGGNPLAAAAHPAGNFVYVANAQSSTIGIYAVDSHTGALTRLDQDPNTAGVQDFPVPGTNPTFLAVDPKGRVLYVSNATTDALSAFSVDTTTGALTLASTIAIATHPRGITVDPQARFVAVISDGSLLTMCTLDATTGLPTAVDADPGTPGRQDYSTGSNAVSLTVDPSGTRLYVGSMGGQAIDWYVVDPATATLTSKTAVATSSPLNLVVSPSGASLFVADWSLGRLDPFAIAADGTPSPIAVTTYAVSNARAVGFDPKGTFVVAAGDNSDGAVFAYDAQSGALAQTATLGGVPSGGYTVAFAVH